MKNKPQSNILKMIEHPALKVDTLQPMTSMYSALLETPLTNFQEMAKPNNVAQIYIQ